MIKQTHRAFATTFTAASIISQVAPVEKNSLL